MTKSLILLMGMALLIAACSFHAKQPVDDAYYKKTQSVAWPEK